MIVRNLIVIMASIIFLNACSKPEESPSLFREVPSETSGLLFQNTLTSTPALNILNYIYFYNGAGVATADFNNDGLLDVYFTANQTADKIFLNKGNLQFEDYTASSLISNESGWTNGVTIVDINQDGWMDIYLCKVGTHKNLSGENLLYVNQGPNTEGNITFKEKAKSYGLDFKGYATQASFFDYDLDGDLDVFLLNHSTNPNQNYGKGTSRNIINEASGDKLFENKDGYYVNVSEASGIFQSKIGYGLGVSVSDINNDGLPDIYVTNDFFENDYLYLNQGDKTFNEVIHQENQSIGHTTHYSMGNSIADINNDGYNDILSVDMLPEDLETYKTSGTEFNYQIYHNYLKNGYAPQYMQNTLQLNNGNGSFSETGYLSGISATEWSWSPLMEDFDNDGYKDFYITNGILGATNDMDFINFIANDNIQKSLGNGMTKKEMAFIDKIPQKKTSNYFFKNKKDNSFKNVTEEWFFKKNSFSNGAVYADLDNDGDLDILVNNVNENAFLLENKRNEQQASQNYLKIQFEGTIPNRNGIGAKVLVFQRGQKQVKENFPTKGYLSAVAPELLFGLDTIASVDSIKVIWPNKNVQVIKNISSNQTLRVFQRDAKEIYAPETTNEQTLFTTVLPVFDYTHKENTNLDFNRDPLLPFSYANEGPSVAVADVNNDHLPDVCIGGGKGQATVLWIQKSNGGYNLQQPELFEKDALSEDVSQVFFDADNDGFQDLLIVSGGNEFEKGNAISPRLYFNKQGTLVKDSLQFQNTFINASKVSTVDFNNDGAMDICITANSVPHHFGYSPTQYLFQNNGKGFFKEVTKSYANAFQTLGNCKDIIWVDIDDNGFQDAIVAGDWMPISIFLNDGEKLTLQEDNGLQKTHGWWNTLKAADFDQDGDLDFIAGNWGLNSRLKASEKEPITLYKKDFDQNHSEETLITYFYQGKETTLASKEELAKQMPFLNKNYLSFKDFAKASVTEIFSEEQLQNALQKKVFELASCYFENLGDNTFQKHPLPFGAQISTTNDLWIEDFNSDGFLDVLLVGNNFEISTQLGRMDASHGTILLNDGKGNFSEKRGEQVPLSGACRNIQKWNHQGKEIFMITRNNQSPIFIKKQVDK